MRKGGRMRTRAFLAGLLVAAVCAVPTSADAATHVIHLGGVPVRVWPGTRQAVTVNHTRGYHARVSFWAHVGGRWVRRWTTSRGRIGYGGLAGATTRHQGSGTTPLGTVRLISSFGTHARARVWRLPYRRIRKGDYWVEDNGSAYYNRYRNKSRGGFRWWLKPSAVNGSERLRDYPRQYEFAVVTSYNYAHPVRHRGAGIFLHVNGRGATAGCVSVPRARMRALFATLKPADVPVMAVGR